LITWVQDLWPESIQFTGRVSNKRILGCLANLVSWIYKNNDLLLAQSRGFLKPIQEKYGPIDVAYFPNPGEERDSYSPAAGVKNFDFFLPIGFNVVFAGNLGSVQSIPTILNAAEILRDHPGIRIILVGSGSLSQWLASEIESRKLKNVVLAGRYPADVMPAIFNQASALLVSLNSDPLLNQTIPAKLQSYLASGKPIIASLDGEGAQIVLDAKAGITCPTENPVALADAIEKLSNMSPDQLVNMGASGRRYFAENFDLQILVKKLIDIFDQTISRYSKKI
jgi:glycosyltransferase involved in cell wall biosynthesis